MSEGIGQAGQPQVLEGDERDLFSKFDEIIRTREALSRTGWTTRSGW